MFVAADALVLRVLEGRPGRQRFAGVLAMHAVGVSADGHREMMGLQTSSAEDDAPHCGARRRGRGSETVGEMSSDLTLQTLTA
ncbi:hypothetical protein AB1207_22340 [Kineococcus endophyticus]|uniref:Uncharacterized protein n=1 Tax=Kineococcus endophyticus TaxID=1181883 RepID=A0ABV3PCW5_9ACTN